jgi:hypothetical protein
MPARDASPSGGVKGSRTRCGILSDEQEKSPGKREDEFLIRRVEFARRISSVFSLHEDDPPPLTGPAVVRGKNVENTGKFSVQQCLGVAR